MESSRYWGKNANLAPTVQNINIYRSVTNSLMPANKALTLLQPKG
jgi:hypothetical protein